MDMPLSELFVAVCNCGLRQGVEGKALHKFAGPDGLHIVLNSTNEKVEFIEPLHCAIFAREGQAFPIAVLNPYTGQVIANPDWTEETLIAAFKAQAQGQQNEGAES